jgi:hypothetical protein
MVFFALRKKTGFSFFPYSRGFPALFQEEAVDKRPSAALNSSFVTAADKESCLIPQDLARLAYDHFSTAS